MKIAAAQIKLDKGITQVGLARHVQFIQEAVSHKADVILFPELSLSGYEPTIINDNLLIQDDPRLHLIKEICKAYGITALIGGPLSRANETLITTFIIKPSGDVQIYSKQYLHCSEEAFFAPGTSPNKLSINSTTLSLGICYESKVKEHFIKSASMNPAFHLVSVVEDNITKTIDVLSDYASTYHLPILISNCVGESGGYECNGGTCCISKEGILIATLDNTREGLLIVDTNSLDIEEIYL